MFKRSSLNIQKYGKFKEYYLHGQDHKRGKSCLSDTPTNSMLQHSYVAKMAPIHDFSMLIKNQCMEWRVVLLTFIISLI